VFNTNNCLSCQKSEKSDRKYIDIFTGNYISNGIEDVIFCQQCDT
jgi:hypothetical protein